MGKSNRIRNERATKVSSAPVVKKKKEMPSWVMSLIAIVITIVTCCFMTADYQMIMDFIKYQFPEEKRKDLSRGVP